MPPKMICEAAVEGEDSDRGDRYSENVMELVMLLATRPTSI